MTNRLPYDKTDEWDRTHPTLKAEKKSTQDTFYYVCTPYSKFPGGLEEAYQMAAEQTMLLLRNNIWVYTPIVHSHTPAKYAPDLWTHDFWLGVDFKFVRLSKGIIVCKLDGWEESFGINEEIKLAKELNLPIYYCNFGEIPVELRNND